MFGPLFEMSLDMARRTADHWQKLFTAADIVMNPPDVKVGCTPHEVVYCENKLKLLHYHPVSDKTFPVPVLIVYALVNRPYILDLMPGKSVVEHLVKRGFDVYLIDWGVPDEGDRVLSLKHYLDRYMVNCLDVIKCRTGAEKTSLIGYCMGGTMAAMFTALYPERVKNLITMAAPFDFSGREGLLFHWTAGTKFDPNLLVDTYGNCPTWFLESSFLLLKPLQNTVGKLMSLYENSTNEKFVENYLAMETWLNDNIPMAGETYREFVSDLFQKNQLMKGKKRINGRVVRLSDITCPVLNLVADKDHLVPPESSIPFNDAIGSEDKEVISFPAGHIGLSVGGRAVKELWPKVCGWLAERSK